MAADLYDRIIELFQQADGLIGDGEWNESNELLLGAIQLSEQHLGRDHDLTLTGKTVLAYNHRAQGRYQEAEELDSTVLSRRRETLGEAGDTAKSLNNLALDLKCQGRNEEGLCLEQQALDMMILAEGEDSEAATTSMHNLANSYRNVERYRDAARLHERALDVRIRTLGREHFQSIITMDMLGMDYSSLGETDKAIQNQEAAVELAKATLGEFDETTIKCLINLATTYGSSSDGVKAIRLMEGAHEASQRAGYEDNPTTVGVMNGLAVAYCDAGRYADAKPLLVRCYEWNKSVLGLDHPRTKISSQNLGFVLNELGDLLGATIF